MSETASVPRHLVISDLCETYRPQRNPPHRHLGSNHNTKTICYSFTCTEITQTSLQTSMYNRTSPQMNWDSIQEPWNNSLNTTQFSSTHLGTFDRSVSMKPALSTSTLGASEELPPTAGTHPLPSPQSAHSMLMYFSLKV